MGLVFPYHLGYAADTCMFAVTADDMPPNIVILIDNGTEMKHPVTHGDYDPSVDYTPSVDPEVDVVPTALPATGFLMITVTVFILPEVGIIWCLFWII